MDNSFNIIQNSVLTGMIDDLSRLQEQLTDYKEKHQFGKITEIHHHYYYREPYSSTYDLRDQRIVSSIRHNSNMTRFLDEDISDLDDIITYLSSSPVFQNFNRRRVQNNNDNDDNDNNDNGDNDDIILYLPVGENTIEGGVFILDEDTKITLSEPFVKMIPEEKYNAVAIININDKVDNDDNIQHAINDVEDAINKISIVINSYENKDKNDRNDKNDKNDRNDKNDNDNETWSSSSISSWSDSEPEIEGDREPVKCVVCQENIIYQQIIKRLKCNHIYHKDCIDNHLLICDVRCPICRHDVRNDFQYKN